MKGTIVSKLQFCTAPILQNIYGQITSREKNSLSHKDSRKYYALFSPLRYTSFFIVNR